MEVKKAYNCKLTERVGEYFFGIETYKSDKPSLEKFVDISLSKALPCFATLAGIIYWCYSSEPHIPSNIVLASELFRLFYYKVNSQEF